MAISMTSTTSTQEELDHSVGPNGKIAPTVEEQAKWGKTETEVPGATEKEAETISESETEPQEAEGKSEPETVRQMPKGVHKKIDKEVARRKAAEEERDKLLDRLATLEKASKPAETEKVAAKVNGEPKLEEFPSRDEWLIAKAKWEIRQENAALEVKKAEDAKQARTQGIYDSHNARLADAKDRYEDFDEQLKAADTPWKDNNPDDVESAQAFKIAIFESENGPDILYHLATHPDEFAKFSGKSPSKTQMMVGSLSSSLLPSETPKAVEKPKSKLNPPIKPVGGGGTSISAQDLASAADTSQAAYRKARNGRAGRFD
jgi:hypothetical protein